MIICEGEVMKLGEFPVLFSSSALVSARCRHSDLTLFRVLMIIGRTLASTRVSFYDSEDKGKRKLLAIGSHTKHVEKSWERSGGVRTCSYSDMPRS